MSEPVRVLIVDDDFRVADIHRGFMEEAEGFTVVGSAQSGEAALRLSKELEPDLVLLDIYLPDGLGTDVLVRLRASKPVDCFVLTAARDLATVRRCHDLGALHYLVKPFSKRELVDRLHEYRRWRTSMAGEWDLDQHQVDQLFHGFTPSATQLPKGLSQETMDLVVQSLTKVSEPMAAEDVAQMIGISRVSVRRYLRHLAEIGQASIIQDYGTPGRPRHRFRLV